MAEHNNTICDYNTGMGPREFGCMMNIRDSNRKVDIYLPINWITKGISDADVLQWNTIGNSTLFPAVVSKVYDERIKIYNFTELNGLRITCKKDVKYKQSDASCCVYGEIISIGLSNGYFTTVSKTHLSSNYTAVERPVWHGYACDYQLEETGECLDQYIKRILAEKPQEDQGPNAYKITIDCRTSLSRSHNLAVLTFYRFLWSNLYNDIVSNTLNIIKEGVDPWIALYYAMSAKRYSPGYGLLAFPGYIDVDSARKNLINGRAVNNSFSADRYTETVIYPVANVKGQALRFAGVPAVKEIATCTSKTLKTLTYGKKYFVSEIDARSYMVDKTDDYRRMRILKKHFNN